MNTNEKNELKSFVKEIWKSMPMESKRTMAIGCISTTASIASCFVSGNAKKVLLGTGIVTWIATCISSMDAKNKIFEDLDAQIKEIEKNWEVYKASHPEIFSNN